MRPDSALQQQLLELCYDLLDAPTAAELHRRIAAEPEVARAYADAQRTAGLLAAAARLPADRIVLSPKTADERTAQAHTVHADIARTARRSWEWLASLAAALLLLLTGASYWWRSALPADSAAEHLRLLVTGPARIDRDVTNRFAVRTTDVDGRPLSTDVQYSIYSGQGDVLLDRQARSDSSGALAIEMPAQLIDTSSARLEVLAVHHGKLTRTQTRLNVDRERYLTQLALDKPLYQPGETVYYRSLTLGRFSLVPAVDLPLQFEIHDPSGAVVPGSTVQGVTQQGVGSGVFVLPPELPGGEYKLIARSVDGSVPEETRKFFVRQYRLPRLNKELEFVRDSYAPGDRVVADFSAARTEGGPAAGAALRVVASVDGQTVYQAALNAGDSGALQIEFALPKEIEKGDGQLAVVVDDGGTVETIAKTIPINLGKLEVTFYPEGGDLVADLENRVYFVCRNPVGKPVHLEGRVLDEKGNAVADLDTIHKGMGAFRFTPGNAGRYTLDITSPPGIANRPELPSVNAERQVVLNVPGSGVFDAGKPLVLDLHARREGLPLVVAAYCRGVPVGEQALVTREGANSVELSIAPEASGVVRVTVFDYRSTPPEPVAERLVYRQTDRRLNVRVADHSERYSPGEAVDLSLMVTDENNQPTPAVLGVAVVDDALLRMADDETPQMTTHYYLTSELEKPEDLEKADFYLSADPAAPQSLDLLLGTQGWRRFVERTVEQLRGKGEPQPADLKRLVALGGAVDAPALFDSLPQARRDYQAERAAQVAGRTVIVKWLGRIVVCVSLGLFVVIALAAVARTLNRKPVWIPSLATATACFLVGLSWLDFGRPGKGVNQEVAFADFAAPTRAVNQTYAPYAISAPDQFAMDANAPRAWNFFGAEREGLDKTLAESGPMDQLLAEQGQGENFGFKAAMLQLGDALDGSGLPGGGAMPVTAQPLNWNELNLRRRLLFAAGDRRDLGRLAKDAERLERELASVRFTAREYAHQHVVTTPGVRSDFAETLFWHPLLIAGADGRAPVHFELNDSVTTFRVLVDAHSADSSARLGRIGTGSGAIISRIPFNLEPKLPLEVNAGDRLDVPVAVVNDTLGELPVSLLLSTDELLRLEGTGERELKLPAGGRMREYFPLVVAGQTGTSHVTVRGQASQLTDAKQQSVRVVPPGFPVAQSYAGRLDGTQELKIELPADWVPGSLEVVLSAYPSTLASLQQGMDSILREPAGCFEQASTSNYPNVLSLQYLQEHKVANPDVTRRAKDLLKSGYAKLTGYECKEKGYEWFGSDPGHEALTAYGLMEFRDMAQVYDVDPQMIERTRHWLLERRDGQGGFQRNPQSCDSFGAAPQPITDAYIVWALAEAGERDIDRELDHVIELASKSDDPYLVALAAGGAVSGHREAAARQLLTALEKQQHDDGHLTGKEGSITRSGGLSLDVETTSLAALAWLKSGQAHGSAEKAVQWLVGHRQGDGGFGSTQATILALKALVAHAQANRAATTAGELLLERDGRVIGRQAFGADTNNTITLEGWAGELEPGENALTIRLTGNNAMPYSINVGYRVRTPESHEACPVRLSTRLSAVHVAAGETVALEAELRNTTDKGQPMTIAVLGLPAGLQPRADQLEELKKAKQIDYYETRAREVICYWRALAPEQKIALRLDLVAEWPGQYTGPASRAYLYYTAEQKQWVAPLMIEVGR